MLILHFYFVGQHFLNVCDLQVEVLTDRAGVALDVPQTIHLQCKLTEKLPCDISTEVYRYMYIKQRFGINTEVRVMSSIYLASLQKWGLNQA